MMDRRIKGKIEGGGCGSMRNLNLKGGWGGKWGGEGDRRKRDGLLVGKFSGDVFICGLWGGMGGG